MAKKGKDFATNIFLIFVCVIYIYYSHILYNSSYSSYTVTKYTLVKGFGKVTTFYTCYSSYYHFFVVGLQYGRL